MRYNVEKWSYTLHGRTESFSYIIWTVQKVWKLCAAWLSQCYNGTQLGGQKSKVDIGHKGGVPFSRKKACVSDHIWEDTGNYSCKTCDYTSRQRDRMTRHYKNVHLKEKPYVCTQCNTR